jgi:hypothetical protein
VGDDGQVAAQPVDDVGEDDPVEILRVLPARYHGQFLADYDIAVAGARRPEQYRQLSRRIGACRRTVRSAKAAREPAARLRRCTRRRAAAATGHRRGASSIANSNNEINLS